MNTCEVKNPITLAVNIPADGLFLAILNKANGDFSKETCTRIIKRYIDKYLEANPDMIMLNVCYRRCLTPSNVFDSYLYNIEIDKNGQPLKKLSPVADGVSKYFSSFFSCARILLQNGIDIYKILTEYIRQKGCKVYLSVRMNDGHYTDNPAINSNFALKDNSKYTINSDGKELDFSQKEVRDLFYDYIKELLENYQVDGIELDWLRYPKVLPVECRSDFKILNNYMNTIRRLLDGYNHELSLAVRVLPNEKDNLQNGVDVCQWIDDGSVDVVTIENFYIPTNFEMPISSWRQNIQKRNTANKKYVFLCGSDWGVSCMRGYNIAMTPALVRGFVSNCLDNGADGVYLFNFFEENDTSSFEFVADSKETGYLKNCFSERIKAAKELYTLPKRCVHIGDSNNRYPIRLNAGESYTFSHPIKKPFDICEIVIGCDADVSLSVFINENGKKISLQNIPALKGFEYIPETQIGKESEFIYAISQAAPYVKTAILSLNEDGPVEITIKNNTLQPVNLLWLELSFE